MAKVRKSGTGVGNAKDDTAPPLTLRHLQGIFYILALAWLAGGAVLGTELIKHRRTQPRGRYVYNTPRGKGTTSLLN